MAEIVPLSSSNVAGAGYDAETQVLSVKFLHGKMYRYADVPQSIFDGLMSAESAGKFFNANIKDQYTVI